MYISDFDTQGTTERYFYNNGSGFDLLENGHVIVYDADAQIDVVLPKGHSDTLPMLKDAADYHSHHLVRGG